MSFWEEFGQRITQEGQRAIRKTRDLASVVTMNADISDSKRKINDLYQELGQLVVNEAFAGVTADQLQSALSDEYADETDREIRLTNWQDIYTKVLFIRSEEEVIALNESKIGELKSELRCPDCGKIVAKGMSFCPECGRKLTEQAEVPVETAPEEAAAD
jgi:rRNA maturation endonuclease Nob1